MTRIILLPLFILSLLILALAACAPPAAQEPPAIAPTLEQPAATVVPPLPEPAVKIPLEITLDPPQRYTLDNPQVKRVTTLAINDLAARLSVDRAAIEFLAYEPVTWRDGSLGCPQPDMMYTQATIDGYVVQLRHNGQTYNYNGADGGDPFLCQR